MAGAEAEIGGPIVRPSSPDQILIYMTATDREEAVKITSQLLEKNLIACANIFPEMVSIYTWEGKTEQNPEVAVFMKSDRESFKKLEETVLGLHSYSCPCLVALPLVAGHPAFLDWISRSLHPSPPETR